jgi:transcriptional regulator with XRE-family HTH domain
MTTEQVAAESGVSVDTVRSIEQGRLPNPGVFTLSSIAQVLQASVDDLVQESLGGGT